MDISISKIKPAYVKASKDLSHKLNMAFCLDPQGFKSYLEQIGVVFDVDNSAHDLSELAVIYKNDTDKNGKAFGGKKIDLNIFLDGFIPNKNSINAANCRFVA